MGSCVHKNAGDIQASPGVVRVRRPQNARDVQASCGVVRLARPPDSMSLVFRLDCTIGLSILSVTGTMADGIDLCILCDPV